MKTFLIAMMMLSFGIATFGQDTTALATQKKYYLKKAKNQKTTGWILLAGGTTIAVIGAVMALSTYEGPLGDSGNEIDAGSVMFVTGVTADLVSIPFFISAGNNKRRASQISVSTQNIYLPKNNALTMRYVPSVAVKIDF